MAAHKHAEMIKAKADNMDLVVLVRMAYGDFFTVTAEKECIPSFHPDNKYFLCLPKHKDACLHWLNGGEVEFDSEFVDEWTEYDPFKEWGAGSVFMQNDYKTRIKPHKEKRWIAIYSDGTVCDRNKRTKEEIATYVERAAFYNNCAPENWQFIEIEIEV